MKFFKDMNEPEARELVDRVGDVISAMLPRDARHIVLVFTDPNKIRYNASVERKMIGDILKECARRVTLIENRPAVSEAKSGVSR